MALTINAVAIKFGGVYTCVHFKNYTTMDKFYQPAIQGDLLLVLAVSFQQQEGTTDCGVFSIAAAYHAARGDELESISFGQASMREHLITCLERKELSLFPETLSAVNRNATSFCPHLLFL